MHVARAVGWHGDETPSVPANLAIRAIATDLRHPRQPCVLPDGDILVVESNGPGVEPIERPKDFIMRLVQKFAGAAAKGGNRVIDHRWTKRLTASPDGRKLFVDIGSDSNVMEKGKAAEEERARIREVDRASGAHRPYATGLRNPNGLTFNPQTGQSWTAVDERDELGPDLVPDYMTSVKAGGFYGWPYSYYGTYLDPSVRPQRPDMAAKAISPDYALSRHVAPLETGSAPC